MAPLLPNSNSDGTKPYPHTNGVKLKKYTTLCDEHGLVRVYPNEPSWVPDLNHAVDHLTDSPAFTSPDAPKRPWHSACGFRAPGQDPSTQEGPQAGFVNKTWRLLVTWWYSSTTKSQRDLQNLVEVIGDPDFKKEELIGLNVASELKKMDKAPSLVPGGEWKQGVVKVSLPAPKNKVLEKDAPVLEVSVWHRSLISVMIETFTSKSFRDVHLTPFAMFHKRPDKPTVRVVTEVYNSDAVIKEHQRIQKAHNMAGGMMECVVACFMMWSDSTHLAQFGTASLWPAYAAFGNISKYIRGKATSFCMNDVAYFPSVRTPLLCYVFFSDILPAHRQGLGRLQGPLWT
jgi:hypothetical protein